MNYKIEKDKSTRLLVREDQRIYEARNEGTLARKRRRFRLIDAFAGAGGMTLGFTMIIENAWLLSLFKPASHTAT